jgi:rhodanese-related sulfurtransferase
MKKLILITAAIITVSAFAAGASATTMQVPMAKLCGSCHDPEPGVMMGFLDNIAIKSRTIQMDFMSHKEVVKFNSDTELKYVRSFRDIRNYRKKGFQINFIEKDGEKLATEIIRFDILKSIAPEEKLAKDEFKKLLGNQNVKVYDVRPPVKYKMGHIPGAMPMPAPAFDKFVKNLPEDKTTPIVFYGVGGCLSPTAAMKTKSLGYKDVRIYFGGYPDWSSSEYGLIDTGWLKTAIDTGTPHILIDLRSAEEVARGHIKGAVSIPVASLERSRAQFPLKKNAPIIFYGPASKEAAAKLISWGYRSVRVLPVSYAGWQAVGYQVSTAPAATAINYVAKPKPGTISIEEFSRASRAMDGSKLFIDVRNPDELSDGKIKGAVNIPVDELGQQIPHLPADKEIILYCNSGIRAEMGHNILKKAERKSRYLDARMIFDGDEFSGEEN